MRIDGRQESGERKEQTPLALRRRLLGALGAMLVSRKAVAAAAPERPLSSPPRAYAPVTPGYAMGFPQDEGSHPPFRTEWWYVTGWLRPEQRAPLGFQITFFRTRPETDARNPSAFTPNQLIIAHAALSEASRGKLLSEQKLGRVAFGLAGAEEGRTHVWIDNWHLTQEGTSYALRVPGRELSMTLAFRQTQPPLLQGEDGYSRKGPQPESASYYYSLPQLSVTGTVAAARESLKVTGTAWLDHEWSSSYMDERAAGWDWIGMNLADGAALMVFRMRDREGGKFWAGGSYRSASGVRQTYAPGDVDMTPTRWWRSARTGANYPVAWRVRAGKLELGIEPLMNDQEHDTRASVGTVYWEGAVSAMIEGRSVGSGYLEMTGYWRPMKL